MADIKFVADVMVGKLARWLRVLGYDVAYSNAFDDQEILRLAESENRIILTRDTGLAARCESNFLLVESGQYREQLRQVLQTFGLSVFNVLSRCIECNTMLQIVDKEAVFEKVPPYVYLTQDHFAACPSCGRIFWHGTHAAEMLKQIGGI
jgi:uncharacterized protein with PIN domain